MVCSGPVDRQWYVDSCASQHISNDRNLFVSVSKYHKTFETASNKTITAEGIGNVYLLQLNGAFLLIENIAYVPNCQSNLILVG